MTVKELVARLEKMDEDKVVVFTDVDGGWTNIEVEDSFVTVSIVPSSNMEK